MSGHQFGELRKCFALCRGPSERPGRDRGAPAPQGAFVPTVPGHHSARAAFRQDSHRHGWLWRLRGETACPDPCPSPWCSCTHSVRRFSAFRAQAPLGCRGGFSARHCRPRLCDRHGPGAECAWSLRNPGHCFQLQLLIATSRLPREDELENHSLCFTPRMLHLYVCVKTGDFHK